MTWSFSACARVTPRRRSMSIQLDAVVSSRSRRAGITTFTLSEEGYFASVPVQPGYAAL